MPDLLPRRRMLLASATTLPLLLAATGCRSAQAFAGPDPLAGPPPPSPEVITLEAVIAAEANLIKAYKTAMSGDSRATAQPGDLATLLTQHEQHLAQLQARLVLPTGVKAAAGKSSEPGAIATAPARVTAADLRASERGSAANLVRQLATVQPALAQLFASIAACHATHVAALGAQGGMVASRTATGVPGVPGSLSALQAALAAEDAAIFGYGVAGAHLTGSRQAAAEQDWTGHNRARDTLTAMISRLGAVPVAPQAFYQLPFPVRDAASAMALAAYLEDGVTRAYLGLVAVSDRALRDFGALAMQGSAERAAYWRGSTAAFPGLPASALLPIRPAGRS